MTSNHHTPFTGQVTINDGGTNFNGPLSELDSAITDLLAGTIPLDGLRVGAEAKDTDAIVQMASTDKGMSFPAMTTTQRNAITTPPQGLMIFNSTTSKINYYTGSLWLALGDPENAIEVIDSGSFSAATTTTISSIPATYQDLWLRLTIEPDANDSGEVLELRFNADSTSGNYSYNHNYNATISHLFTADALDLRYMDEKTSNAANIRAEYLFKIQNYASTDNPTVVQFSGCFVVSAAETVYYVRGGFSWHKQAFEAVSSIVFGSPLVNTSGKWKIYGVQ